MIAEEADEPGSHCGVGFCPIGFYVPDWWDVNNESVIPGSEHWDADHEWPIGDFGFVWGCYWGDDSAWKVQCLDLSRVQQGVVRREERFGYVELATFGFTSPCQMPDVELSRKSDPPHFIEVSRCGGVAQVTFAIQMRFDLESGKPEEWQRLKIANWKCFASVESGRTLGLG